MYEVVLLKSDLALVGSHDLLHNILGDPKDFQCVHSRLRSLPGELQRSILVYG